MKKFGYIAVGPAEFLIHQRLGRLKRVGRGIGFFSLPLIDRHYIVPSTANRIGFLADQITAENQGIEVSGFAIWKVNEPEKVSLTFDFSDARNAIEQINGNLKDVVESAIRHKVANMTIEEVLRKRGSIILELKRELAYIAEQWGLIIETIEIKNVRIMSEQLFTNMQAKFRDTVRLESERSALDTEQQIGGHRYAQREQLALQEQEFQRRETERRMDLAKVSAAADAEIRAAKMRQEKEAKAQDLTQKLEIATLEHVNREKLLTLETTLIEAERPVQTQRFGMEEAARQHQLEMGLVDDKLRQRQMETSNREDATLQLIRNLPAIAGALRVNELNVRENALSEMASALAILTSKREES